jgi:hypothetical protein
VRRLESSVVDIRDKREISSDAGLAGDPRWLLVQRIVASSGFANSQRLSAFLLYVSRQSLARKGDALNERLIGEAVFERSPDYDPRDDNIVRSHASRLRARLEEYFEREGASERMKVSIPRGSYAPVFEQTASPLESAAVETTGAGNESVSLDSGRLPGQRKPLKIAFWGAVGLVIVAAAIAATVAVRYRRYSAEHTPSHKLWSQMFRKQQQTLIVPADSSLVIRRLLSGHQVALANYAGGQYKQDPGCTKPCDPAMIRTVESLRYTSMSDLEFAVKVTHLPEAIPERTEIRYARDLELKDLKESNVILAGSLEADPWMAAISGEMNFVLHDDPAAGPLRVENRHPQATEKSEYLYEPHNQEHDGLATIAFLPNLGGSGNLLVVQGFSLAGTQAAAEFVTSGRDLDALLGAHGGTGSQLPHFEILLSTVEINGMATRAVPLAWHLYP